MFGFKNDDKKVDVKKINEVLSLCKLILKFIFVLSLVASVWILIRIFKDSGLLLAIKQLLYLSIPLFIGFGIAWFLDPFVQKLKSKKIPSILSAAIAYIIFLGVVFLVFKMILPLLSSQINDLVKTIPTTYNALVDITDNIFDSLSNNFNYDFNELKNTVYSNISKFTLGITDTLPTLIINFVKSLASGIWNFVFGLVIGFYILIDFASVKKNLLTFLPNRIRKGTNDLIGRLDVSLRHYVEGTIMITLLVFITSSLGFTIAGLKAPLLFGMFCGITNIIPYIGPYLGGIPAVLVGMSISPTVGIVTLIVVFVIQFIESMFIQPLVMSKAMKLHPVTIVMSLLIFGYFFQIIGMILATPIVSGGKIILSFFNEKFHVLDFWRGSKNYVED